MQLVQLVAIELAREAHFEQEEKARTEKLPPGTLEAFRIKNAFLLRKCDLAFLQNRLSATSEPRIGTRWFAYWQLPHRLAFLY